MPPDIAAIRTFFVVGAATYSNCQLTWDTVSNTFTVDDPLKPASHIMQESFDNISKISHEHIELSCLTLVLNLRWHPEEKIVKSPRLIFVFHETSSAVDFHKVLLPLNKDYVKSTAICSCRDSLGNLAREALSHIGGKRGHGEAEEQPSTKRSRRACVTTLTILPHLQPRVSEILANKTRMERSVEKAPEDTIVISSRLGPNHRQLLQSAPAALLRLGDAAILPRRSTIVSGQPALTSSASPSIPNSVTTPDLDTDTEKSFDEQYLGNQRKIDALNKQQEMLWKDRFDECKKRMEDLKAVSFNELTEVREENGKLNLEKTRVQENFHEAQQQLAQANAENNELRADIQLLKDLFGRVTGPLVQLDVDHYLNRIKSGDDAVTAKNASIQL